MGAVAPDAHPHKAAGPLVKAKTVKKPEGTDTPRTSRASGERQNPQGTFCLRTLFAHSRGRGLPTPLSLSPGCSPPGCGCLGAESGGRGKW